MNKLLTLAALTLAACAEPVVFSDETAPETLEIGGCEHTHEHVEVPVVKHAAPLPLPAVEAETVAYTEAAVESPAGGDDMGRAHCFDFEALDAALEGTKVAVDDFAAGLVIGGYRPCVDGESASLRINIDPGTHGKRLATANPGRLTLHMGQWSKLTVPARCLGALSLRVAAHEALHVSGVWSHTSSGLMAPAIASDFCSETIDSTLAEVGAMNRPRWTVRYNQ